MYELRTLGTVALTGGGPEVGRLISQPKRLALLTYLAVAKPRGVQRRDRIVGLLWPELGQAKARAALSQTVYELRRALGKESVISHGADGLSLLPEAVRCDAVAFDTALESGEPERALDTYRGDFLAGFFLAGCPEFRHWQDAFAADLRRSAVAAATGLGASARASGDTDAAAEYAGRVLRMEPENEGALRLQMDIALEAGRHTAALRAYDEFRDRLRERLELEPSPYLVEYAEHIRAAQTPTGPDPASLKPAAERATSVTEPSAAPVIEVRDSQADATLPRPRRSILGKARTLAAPILVAVTILAVFAIRRAIQPPSPIAAEPDMSGLPTASDYRLVVIPCRYIGEEPEREYLAIGLTDFLILTLGRQPGLAVPSMQSVLKYRSTSESPTSIGSAFEADAVVECSVQADRDGNTVITSSLTDVASGEQIWVDDFPGDIAALDSRVDAASAMVEAMRAAAPGRLSSGPRVRRFTSDTVASRLFETGLYSLYALEHEELRRSRDLFEAAVARDSAYLPALAMLGSVYATLGRNVWDPPPLEAYPLALSAIERALEIDPGYADAWATLGLIRAWFEWDWNGADEAFATAVELDPGNAGVHVRKAHHLAALGRFEEAFAADSIARDLDIGAQPFQLTNYGWHLYLAGRFEEAIDVYDFVLSLEPELFHAQAVRNPAQLEVFVQRGQPDSVFALLDGWVDDPAFEVSPAYVLAVAGRTDSARALVRTYEDDDRVRSLRVALVYGALGDLDKALDWLEVAEGERDPYLTGLNTRPYFKPFQGHPRFEALRARMGLDRFSSTRSVTATSRL